MSLVWPSLLILHVAHIICPNLFNVKMILWITVINYHRNQAIRTLYKYYLSSLIIYHVISSLISLENEYHIIEYHIKSYDSHWISNQWIQMNEYNIKWYRIIIHFIEKMKLLTSLTSFTRNFAQWNLMLSLVKTTLGQRNKYYETVGQEIVNLNSSLQLSLLTLRDILFKSSQLWLINISHISSP